MLTARNAARFVSLLLVAAVGVSCGGHRAQPPAGPYLVYTRHHTRGAEDVWSMWIARVDGTHPRLLVRNGLFGALSPDGRWVAFNRCLGTRAACQMSTDPFGLFVVGTAGGKPRLLSRSTLYPAWSPRSDRIVAYRRGALVSLDLDSHVRVPEEEPAGPGWSFSPDGKWVVYAEARQHTKCGSDLVVVGVDGEKERRLTRARDAFPVWAPHWIAFSRYPKSCASARRIWRVRPDGSGPRPVTPPPAPQYARNGYYGFDPVEWAPDERVLLAGLSTEWGPEAIRVDVATGRFRKLSGYAVDLSRDGRFALVDSGGAEGPQEFAVVTMANGRRRVLVHGDVAAPSWNR
jgi:Tol biopolymer transport system component